MLNNSTLKITSNLIIIKRDATKLLIFDRDSNWQPWRTDPIKRRFNERMLLGTQGRSHTESNLSKEIYEQEVESSNSSTIILLDKFSL